MLVHQRVSSKISLLQGDSLTPLDPEPSSEIWAPADVMVLDHLSTSDHLPSARYKKVSSPRTHFWGLIHHHQPPQSLSKHSAVRIRTPLRSGGTSEPKNPEHLRVPCGEVLRLGGRHTFGIRLHWVGSSQKHRWKFPGKIYWKLKGVGTIQFLISGFWDQRIAWRLGGRQVSVCLCRADNMANTLQWNVPYSWSPYYDIK
jgi:hypothetical protein